MQLTHTIYFDRQPDSIYGVLTLQRAEKGKAFKVFERFPCSSGQRGNTTTDWVQGKSPTPMGVHWMSTKQEHLQFEPKGTPFYPMGTSKGSRRIEQPDGPQYREHIGLHLENRFPGTAGCPALLWDTPERECSAWALFAYLDKLHKYEPYIRFVVL